MAWKHLKQRSLADAAIVDHAALQELDSLNEMINWSQIEVLLSNIHLAFSSKTAEAAITGKTLDRGQSTAIESWALH